MAEVLYEVDTDVSLPGFTFADYTYLTSQPHAVTGVEREAGTDSFGYDNTGNMTSRTEDGTGWTQIFNAEGRLSSISDGVDTWGFAYDGDGVRLMQSNPDGSTTLYLAGGSYEVHIDGLSTDITHYYAIAGERVMRDSSGNLHYLLTDHLGSVVAVTDASGNVESQQRYAPYGLTRFDPGISETDFSYTGQRALEDIGLMDYHARWYSPTLGRFISADTIVPEPGNSQAWNRYAYVVGNPVGYVDPSGNYYITPYNTDTDRNDPSDPPIKTTPTPPGYESDSLNDRQTELPLSTPIPYQPYSLPRLIPIRTSWDLYDLVPCMINPGFLCEYPSDATGYSLVYQFTGSKLIIGDVLTSLAAAGGVAISIVTSNPVPAMAGVAAHTVWEIATAYTDPSRAAQMQFESQLGMSDLDPNLVFSEAIFELLTAADALLWGDDRDYFLWGPIIVPVPTPAPR